MGRGKAEAVEPTTGDVFVDLGFADAGERRLRVRLAMLLNEAILELGLTQVEAAARLGIAQPHVSELRHFKLRRFSSERLLRFLALLGRQVEIVVRRSRRGTGGRLSVSVD